MYWLYLATRHDAYHLWNDELLFDLAADPHQQSDLAKDEVAVVARCRGLLDEWLAAMLPSAARGRDPHENVMVEGGPYHVRGQLPAYLARLRATDRTHLAERLEARWSR